MNELTNEQLRKVLKVWTQSGQIERHQVPVVSDGLMRLLVGLVLGAGCGFVWGVLVSVKFLCGGG